MRVLSPEVTLVLARVAGALFAYVKHKQIMLGSLANMGCAALGASGIALAFVSIAVAQAPRHAAEQAKGEESGYELVFPAMGTMLAFQAFSDDEQRVERVFGEAREEIERLAEILSDYSAESETVLLSQADKVGQWQKTSPELFEVLQVCDRWHRLSDGAFDASIGRLTVLWRKARKLKTIPSEEEIRKALEHCGWEHVKLDPQTRSVKLDIEGLKFDFGAMGKGYIIDKAYQRLAAGGLPRSLVRAGGDLRCGDPPLGRDGWRIEIAQLDKAETEAPRLQLANAAVSSSGDLYQYIEINGQRRSHVLDPRTGIGVPGPRMVTVIASTSTEADAADTALCVMSDEAAMKLAEQLGNIDMRIVTAVATSKTEHSPEKPIVRMTSGFERRLQFLKSSSTAETQR